jgi:hypothetical protein
MAISWISSDEKSAMDHKASAEAVAQKRGVEGDLLYFQLSSVLRSNRAFLSHSCG